MDGKFKKRNDYPTQNSSESLLNSADDEGFIGNLKENKDIGPWEQENNKVFDLFCSELEGSKQFFKHSLHQKSRQKRKKKKTVKNEEHHVKYLKDKTQSHQNNAQDETTLATQLLSSVQQSLSYRGSKYNQDINNYPNYENKGYEIQREYNNQFLKQNSKLLDKNAHLIIQSFADQQQLLQHPSQNYHVYTKRKSLNDENLSVNNNSFNSDEKIMMESFKRKSQSLAKQHEQINNSQNQGNQYHLASNSSNGNYQNILSTSQLAATNNSQQQFIGYFDQIQANQVEQLEKKILQKYFAFYPQSQQQQQQQTLSPKNQIQVKNSQPLIMPSKRDSPSPKALHGNNFDNSSTKNIQPHTKDIQFPQNEATQLQQALKNQSIKFKKIKSLRSKFKPISSHSSQEKIKMINIKDSSEKPPLPNLRQKYQTQEDIPSNQNTQSTSQNTSKNLPVLKGSGYAGIYFDPPQQKLQKDKIKFELTQQTQPVLLQNQKYHHQNQPQSQNIQLQPPQKLQQLQQYQQPQSARDYSSYDQAISTISRQGDSQSRKNSFRYSRVESRDSYHQVNQIKHNQKYENDSSRITPLKNNTSTYASQFENSKVNNDLRQQYFTNSPWQKKNTSKLPQLILSSILNNGNNNDDQVAAINIANRNSNTLDEVIQNTNSSRIVNFPLYEDKPPTSRHNYHLNPHQQTKYIQLYYYRTIKKLPINSPRDFSLSPQQQQQQQQQHYKHIN